MDGAARCRAASAPSRTATSPRPRPLLMTDAEAADWLATAAVEI
ncbi:hypothetical protein [Streptomyces sp. NPDC017673]